MGHIRDTGCMPRSLRSPEAAVRLIDWADADELDLDGTATRLDDDARRRFETDSPTAARRFLIGRALLARTVADALGRREQHVRTTAHCPSCGLAHGRPGVTVDGETVHASISHTEGTTAVAVSTEFPLGVDVERVDARRFAGVETVALSPAELHRWQRSAEPDRLRSLAELWTMKEAVLKALGAGLTVEPATIESPQAETSDHPTALLGNRFLLSRPQVGPHLVLAVARLLP